jgi:hypothetical protein
MNRLMLLFCVLVLLAACAKMPVDSTSDIATETANEDLQSLGIYGQIQTYTTPRDPWLEPFSPASIWNLPLGNRAKYVTQGYGGTGVLPAEDSVTADAELHYKEKASDPSRTLYAPGSFIKRCDGTRFQNENPNVTPALRVPDDFIVPDAVGTPGEPGFSSPNNVATFLRPNGYDLFQLEPLARCVVGGPVYGFYNPQNPIQNIFGLGLYGTHFGSGLSGFGGSIRYGELTSNTPIRHALKLNIYGRKYLAYNDDGTRGFRWPADRADAYAGGTDGYCSLEPCKSNPLRGLEMGALLAIPQGITPESLGLKTEPAKKMFYALQTYGTYIVDDSFFTTHAWSVVDNALGEFQETYGFDFAQSKFSSGPAKDWYDDQMKLITALALIDDSSPATPGGAGGVNRRAPFASPFFKPTDKRAPSSPSNLQATDTKPKSVTLQWNASTDNVRVMIYEVLQNGVKVGETYGKMTFEIKGLTPETSYSFTVRAVDTGLNVSSPSSALNVTTPAIPPNSYETDFSEGSGWTLNNAAITLGKLQIGNGFQPSSFAIYDPVTFVANYTLTAALKGVGTDNGNKSRVYFNYQNAQNTYFLELGGQGLTKLVKLSNGSRSELGSTTALIAESIEITYESGGYISAKVNGQSVFSQVRDLSFKSGKIGFGGEYDNLEIDDLTVGGPIVPEPQVGFSSNFDDGTAPGWTFDPPDQTFLRFSRMDVGNFGASASAFHEGTNGASFSYSFDLFTYASDVQFNIIYVYFNASDADNGYALELTGGANNRVRLLKKVSGTFTELATAPSYTIQNDSNKARFTIFYDSSAKTISVLAERSGVTTQLFNAVNDASFTGGRVGFGISFSQAVVDNVVLQ